MKILFLHGWQSTPGGIKPTWLKNHGHTVLNPALPDDDFDETIQIAQGEFDRGKPDVVVGSSRGGAVAMNINSGSTPLVLLCPAWKRWGIVTSVKPNTVILHSPADEVVPFADSEELLRNSGLSSESLVEVGTEHRLADEESLKKMLEVVERVNRTVRHDGPNEERPREGTTIMNVAPEPILKAALMTLHWAMVFCRNWTCCPDVPVKMVNGLMEAVHAIPSILIHWNDQHSFNEILLQLSRFDGASWKRKADTNIFDIPNLTAFFQDRLQDFDYDGSLGR